MEMGLPGVNECVCTNTPLLIPGKAFTFLNRFFKKKQQRETMAFHEKGQIT